MENKNQHWIEEVEKILENDQIDDKKLSRGLGISTYLNNIDYVKKFINKGAKSHHYSDAVSFAIINDNDEILKLLIDNGADVNKKDGDLSPLYEALLSNSVNTSKILIEHGADVNEEVINISSLINISELSDENNLAKIFVEITQKLRNGYYAKIDKQTLDLTCLLCCSIYFNTDIAKLFIEHGADVNKKDDALSPLFLSITLDKLEITKLLIEHGADVNTKDRIGRTTIYAAISSKKPIEILNFLIEYGADVNAKTENNMTALLKAIISQAPVEVIKLLIEHGADVNVQIGDYATALLKAIIFQAPTEVIRLLVDNGADVNAKTKDNLTILFMAIQLQAPIEVIKLLVEHGAEVNAKIGDNGTVLFMAIQLQAPTEVIKLLVEHSADVNAKIGDTVTVFLSAIMFQAPTEVIKLLVKHGADVNAKIGDNVTILFMAVISQAPIEVIKLLVENGADVNAKIGDNVTVLLTVLLAAIMFQAPTKVIKLLVEHGADVNAKIGDNGTALLAAIMFQAPIEVIKLLVEHGADVNANYGDNDKDKAWTIYTFTMLINAQADVLKLFEKHNKYTKPENISMLKNLILEIFEEENEFMLPTDKPEIRDEIVSTKQVMRESKKKLRDLKKNPIENNTNINNDSFRKIQEISNRMEMIINSFIQQFYEVIDDLNDKLQDMWDLIAINFKNIIPTPLNMLKNALSYGIGINDDFNGKHLLSIAFKHQDKKMIKYLIDNGADVNIDLENGSTLWEYVNFIKDQELIDMVQNAHTFKKPSHNPKRLVKILKNFIIDKPIKSTTHNEYGELVKEYKTFDIYISAIKDQFESMDIELKDLSPNLYKKIYTFLLETDPSDDYSWCSKAKINIGWSSLAGLGEWYDSGKNPFDFELKESFIIGDEEITVFSEVIELFKQEIEIRTDFKSLEKIFSNLSLGRDFNLKTLRLNEQQFYTDVEKFTFAINKIFDPIKKRKEFKHIEVIMTLPDSDYCELKITQKDSMATLNAENLLEEIKDGDFKDIKLSLKNLCDWSIEGSFEEENFRINYLTSNNTKDKEILNYKPNGFTHILKFYK